MSARIAGVGGGSYHWEIADRAGRRWFATVDDLDHKAWLGDLRTVAFEGLRHAFDTSVALRERGLDFRLVDQTATDESTSAVIARLDAEGFRPDLIIFCSTTPTLDADVQQMARLRAHFQAPLIAFGPHAAAAPRASMERAPQVDGMLVGEPEDAIVALASPAPLTMQPTVPSSLM